MIKQIFGKIPRKHSKSAGEPSPSSSSLTTSKRSEGGNKRLSSAVDDVISAPYSVLSIGNNPEDKFVRDKNSRLNGNLVSASYEALPSFRDVPTSEKQLLFIRKRIYSSGENKVDGVDLEEDEPAMDPAWPHLQVVYEFLLRSQGEGVLENNTTPHLWEIYGASTVHRKAINNIFYHFILRRRNIMELLNFLKFLGSIINGFALPLKEEHKLFLVRTLIPLHKPKCLAMYHQQLSYCITQFVEKDCKLADIIIRGLIKYWPVTNSSKEVLFLNELEEVLEATQAPEFQRCMVAERALFLWNNDHIENLIKQNRKVILPIIFPSLEKNARHHWNQAVHSLTLNVRKIFYDLDPDLFKACQIKFQNDEAKENEVKERREAIWKRLEEVAAEKAASNQPILVP
ncbi:UNVERIFIED_CONTAM: Serine/threonine protein phosphatase 2A regulatory subunit B' eta isoform [Sesamum calycinum]|uniref:Serine/threonine protein phosphatase 2A regulatory subunit B' eta isoform n=1 Tax=Sesamum calycinum TaxID=2727403 RepID=A0AAW2PNH8_9LAMI